MYVNTSLFNSINMCSSFIHTLGPRVSVKTVKEEVHTAATMMGTSLWGFQASQAIR